MFHLTARPASHLRRRALTWVSAIAIIGLIASCATVPGTPIAADDYDSSSLDHSQLAGDLHSANADADGSGADGGNAGPSSRQLIATALEAGQIDGPTSWLYRTWATFNDSLLPDPYSGMTDGHDIELLTGMTGLLAELPSDVREQIEPYLLRPTDPRSVYSTGGDDPPGLRSSAGSALPYKTAKDQQGSQCSNGWDTATVDGAPFRLWACRDRNGTDPNATQNAMTTAAHVVKKYAPRMIDDMGPVIPDNPASDPDPRADDRIDIYLVPPHSRAPARKGLIGGKGNEYAYVMSESTSGGKVASSYMVVNTSHLEHPVDDGLVERMLVHELFHVLQYTHNAYLESRWFFDASAEWAASYYVRHDSRRLHNIRLPIMQNASPALLQDPFGLGPYGAYLWPLFMEQEVGPQSVFKSWKALGKLSSSGNDDDVINVLNAQLDVANNFPEFVMRLYNGKLPGEPIATRFKNLDSHFPDGQVPPRTPQILDEETLTIEYPSIFGTGYEFTRVQVMPPKDADPDSGVLVTIMGDLSNRQGGPLSLEALARKPSGDYERQTINYAGNGTRVCVAEDLILVLANQAPDGSNTGSGMIGLTRDEEAGCASVEVTHPQDSRRMAGSGDIVSIIGKEGDDKPDQMPLVITVSDASPDEIARYQVDVELDGGTLASARKLSWPLSDFEPARDDTYRMETSIDLDIDLTDANRPMAIEAVLIDNAEEVDRHAPAAELHGEKQDACLVGEWVIPQGELQRYYDSVDAEADFTVNGSTRLTFFDNEYEYTPDLSLLMQMGSDDFKFGGRATMTGSISGSYSADGSVITTSHERSNIAAVVEVGGKTMDGTGLLGDFISMSPINSAPYECSKAGPVLMFATSGKSRVPIQLSPVG